jgi:predicted AAA+ superfamily ATPase
MIIDKIFAKLYRTYEYPFESSDLKIAKMKEAERTEYYRQCKELAENRAFIQEMQELVRTLYGELACRTVSKVEQAGYRLTLKAIQDLEKRIRTFGNMYKAPSVNRPLKTNL